jgi:hypothetical protein
MVQQLLIDNTIDDTCATCCSNLINNYFKLALFIESVIIMFMMPICTPKEFGHWVKSLKCSILQDDNSCYEILNTIRTNVHSWNLRMM